ncbi:MAG: lytic transglycosylase domain-containing protein [Thermodesulfovibrionales bacterium]|nr:lytic transglycosylase domain-containing protein [Thermodesulfovibrionales bacterium]
MKTFFIILFFVLIFLTNNIFADIHKYTSPDGSIIYTNLPTEKGGKVVYKEPKKKSAITNSGSFGMANINKESFSQIITQKAYQYNLDPDLVKAVIKAESNWNPYAISPKGARGLMQLMPSTANDLGVYNTFDPEENIDGGVRYLKYLLNKFNGNLSLALAAYNAGPARVEKTNSVPAIPETVQYVRRVMSLYTGTPYHPVDSFMHINKKEPTRIIKIELDDGTILFTNSKLIY